MKYFETKKDSLEEAISKAINEKPDSSNELKEVRVKNYKNEPNFFVNDKKDTLDKVSKRDGYGETDLAQYLGQKTGKDPEEIYFDGNDLVYGAKTIVRNARKQPVDKLLAKVKTVRNEYEPNIKESKMGAFFLDMQIDANEMSERDFIKKYKGEMGMSPQELKRMHKEFNEEVEKVDNSLMAQATRVISHTSIREKIDPADIDVKATAADRKAADKNIIIQLRRAQDMEKQTGRADQSGIEFLDKKKQKVDPKIINKALDMFDKMKPNDKQKMQQSIGKSYRDLLKTVQRGRV